jgi:peptide/nickel transport system permease protein
MARFIARRVIGMVAVLFAISVIVFLIFNVIPNSDPALRIAGKNADAELIARVSHDLGLDEPLPIQYLTLMKKIFTGELTSYASAQNVVEQIWEGLPATLSLCIGAGVLWMSLAIVFGYLSAVHAGKFTDRALTILSLVGISMPVFWLAAILLYYLTFKVSLFPTSSYVPLTENPAQWAYHLILPWFTLAVLFIGFYSRVLRSNMLDAMNEDYVRTARAKGLAESAVLFRHVLKNAMIPILTGVVVVIPLLFMGSLLTESFFGIPGLGSYTIDAIQAQDFAVVRSMVFIGSVLYILGLLLTDVSYTLVDPRIKLQ